MRTQLLIGVFAALAMGCGDTTTETDAFLGRLDATDLDATDLDATDDAGRIDTLDGSGGEDVFSEGDAWTVSEVGATDTASNDAASNDAASSDAASSDAASSDATGDAASDDASARDAGRGLGPVQCSPTLACPSGPDLCNDTAPGGVCTCFAGSESCPSGTSCDVDRGACIRDCASDLDCSAGMMCSTLRCQIRRCSGALACPPPYVCSSATSGFCRRPSCPDGTACPSPMSCVGGICVEP